MTFIDTIAQEDANEDVKAMYDKARARHGYLPNMTRLFSHRPKVASAWANLQATIREGELDTRRYELATIAAAGALRSSYCMLAHGTTLLKGFYDAAQITAIATDFRNAKLDPADVAMMDFAEKIVKDASAVTRGDIETLRRHGFSDAEIFDICTVAAARCFYSKILDALGAQPDEQFCKLEDGLRRALTVGRPISGTEAPEG